MNEFDALILSSTALHGLGYVLSIGVGIALGMLGGGGSILATPVLIYLFALPPADAMGYSLAVAGAGALAGALRYQRQGLVDLPRGLAFALPSVAAVYVARAYLTPAIPEEWWIAGIVLSRRTLLLGAFILVMVLAAFAMLGPRWEPRERRLCHALCYGALGAEGLVVGAFTGMVGAGGGFLIVPLLTRLARLEVRRAVGTSLLIIALSSLLGFSGEVQRRDHIDWLFLSILIACTVTGIFIGVRLAGRVPADALRRGFGYFTLLIAAIMTGAEIWRNLA